MGGRGVIRLVAGSAPLRRAVLAFGAFNLADWGRWLSILIYAYGRGGAVEAGVVSLVQLAPAAVIAPFAASLGDRIPRQRVLLLAYGLQATFIALTALGIAAGAPGPFVYGVATIGAIAITLSRPAHGALLPSLARSPEELTAANAASSTVESLGFLAGQGLAGLVLGLGGPVPALAGAAAIMAAGAVSVGGIPVEGTGHARTPGGEGAGPLRTELLGGFSAIRHLPGPRTIVLVLGVAAALWGALDVLIVVLAVDVMALGQGTVGTFNAALGLGGFLGGGIAVALARRRRLAAPFVAGLLAWGLTIAAMGLLAQPLVAGALLLGAGAGKAVMDVAGRTLLQRSAPDEVLTRVLGVVEALFMGAFGLGSIVAPGLVAVAGGASPAFVVAGLAIPAVGLALWGSLREIDDHTIVPAHELALLRAVPMFGPLPPGAQERVARHLHPLAVAAGTTVIREGDRGDRYYLLVEGAAVVTADGRELRRLGPGDGFGEIALLRDVPRTATITTTEPSELLALDRAVFLSAVTGVPESRVAATRIVEERLAVG